MQTDWFESARKLKLKISSESLGIPSADDHRLPPWSRLIAEDPSLWSQALERSSRGSPVLIANNVPGFYNSTTLESLLAVALTLRGANVHVLLCDAVLPACLKLKYTTVSPREMADEAHRTRICTDCRRMGGNFRELGITVHEISDLVDSDAKAQIIEIASKVALSDIPSFRWQGWAVGEHAMAGCLRYFSTGDLSGQAGSDTVLRRYFEAALITASAVDRLTSAISFTATCFHHGIYIPQGVVGEVCRSKNIRVVNWNVAYRKGCFVFSHGDTYHHTLINEPVGTWTNIPFSSQHDQQIREYLNSRWWGSQDWIYFHDTPDDRIATLVRETGLDLSKPTIGLLTNVMWDAQLHYPANAFVNMMDWIEKTVMFFETRPDLQLLIRVHPAEIRGLQKSRQFVADELRAAFPMLPPNVFLIPPESQINTYAAMQRCNCVIIYGTKMGVELTSLGIPVIVAGEAWIRNKGLTIDISSEAEYADVLRRLPLSSRLSEAVQHEARKYAYHFFMRRMIPVSSIKPMDDKKTPFQIAASRLKDLEDGRDEGLDVICSGILKGTPFVFPAELKLQG